MTDIASVAIALQVSLVGYLVTSTFRHMAFPRYFWLLYALALAVPLVVERAARQVPTPDDERIPA